MLVDLRAGGHCGPDSGDSGNHMKDWRIFRGGRLVGDFLRMVGVI